MYLRDLVLHFNHACSYVLMIHCSFLSHFLIMTLCLKTEFLLSLCPVYTVCNNNKSKNNINLADGTSVKEHVLVK